MGDRSISSTMRCGLLLLGAGIGACQGLSSEGASGGDAMESATPSDAGPPLASDVVPSTVIREGLVGRLTALQYRNIVWDVLGVRLSGAELDPTQWGLPPGTNSTGQFSNGADGQPASDDYPLALARLAGAVSARADLQLLTEPPGLCQTLTDACLSSFIAASGLRLFRRPLSTREMTAFTELAWSVQAEGQSADEARRAAVEAMLQSPPFVFRVERETEGELAGSRNLNGFELASRLSFFIWDSAPDQQLLSAVVSDELDGSDAALARVQVQVERMLAAPKARRMTYNFITELADTQAAAFRGRTVELTAELEQSLAASFEAHLWEQELGVSEIFTTRNMSLTPAVARHMGLNVVSEGMARYDMTDLPERVGLLTHPGFIMGFGDAEVGSIVSRGIKLMVRLMCRQPLELPLGLASAADSFNEEFGALTERARSEQRREMALPVAEGGQGNAACWACHSQFEPLAYAFERFDASGRHRGETDSRGRPLPIDGWLTDDLSLPEAERTLYADMAELMLLLSASQTVQECMAEHFLSFATGRAATSVEKFSAIAVHQRLQLNGDGLKSMVEAVVASELFRKQRPAAP